MRVVATRPTSTLPAGSRKQLVEGTWDGTRALPLDAGRHRQTATRRRYVRGFGAAETLNGGADTEMDRRRDDAISPAIQILTTV